MTKLVWMTDRSRQISGQECPRRLFWNYHYQGRGIVPVRLSIPLVVGAYTHQGVAALLRGESVEEAVGAALDAYTGELARRGFDLQAGEDALFVVQEQKALLEALIRLAYYRVAPQLFEEYELLEVEHEDVWRMYDSETLAIDMMARADALLKSKEGSNDLYVLSLKTASVYDQRRDGEASHDVQGLSEVGAIEDRLSRSFHSLKVEGDTHEPLSQAMRDFLIGQPNSPRIQGVKMVYLLKGQRSQHPRGSGSWRQFSPLIWAWKRDDVAGTEYAWSYDWKDADTGQTRRLGRGWERFNVWEEQGVQEWLERLASGQVQPEVGDCLSPQVVVPVPYFRNDLDFVDWKCQTIHEESRWSRRVAGYEEVLAENGDTWTYCNEAFPQYRRSCDWPSACPYIACCFSAAGENPLANGYKWRTPHHPAELVQLEAKSGRNS